MLVGLKKKNKNMNNMVFEQGQDILLTKPCQLTFLNIRPKLCTVKNTGSMHTCTSIFTEVYYVQEQFNKYNDICQQITT